MPIYRTSLVCAKFFALGLCFLGITVLAISATFAIGCCLDLKNFDVILTGTLLKRLGIVTLYNCSLSFLFPLITSMTRGILAPVSTSFVAIIIAVIFGSQLLDRYIPWTISAIYLSNPQLINWISELTIFSILFIGVYGTILWWNYVDSK